MRGKAREWVSEWVKLVCWYLRQRRPNFSSSSCSLNPSLSRSWKKQSTVPWPGRFKITRNTSVHALLPTLKAKYYRKTIFPFFFVKKENYLYRFKSFLQVHTLLSNYVDHKFLCWQSPKKQKLAQMLSLFLYLPYCQHLIFKINSISTNIKYNTSIFMNTVQSIVNQQLFSKVLSLPAKWNELIIIWRIVQYIIFYALFFI